MKRDPDSARIVYVAQKYYQDLQTPPQDLYFKGEWDCRLFSRTISVAGTRKMTRYGELVTGEIAGVMAASGIIPVAGLMEGIDREIHRAVLERGGRSIAVKAGGIDWKGRGEEAALAVEIIEAGGLVLSPYGGDEAPSPGRFHSRNKIITGLSQFLLVIEAATDSHALKLAEKARRSGRTILAVPGPITSSRSKGTALLIKEKALILTDPLDLRDCFGLPRLSGTGLSARVEPDSPGREILDLISAEPLSADQLTRKLGIPVFETGALLTRLCLSGRLVCRNGKYFKGQIYAD